MLNACYRVGSDPTIGGRLHDKKGVTTVLHDFTDYLTAGLLNGRKWCQVVREGIGIGNESIHMDFSAFSDVSRDDN